MLSPSTRIGRQTSLLLEQSHEHLALPPVSAWQLSVTPMAYRTVITIPKTQSQEKISLLLTVGAEVLTVPEKPYSDLILTTASHRDSRKEKGWFWANQFDNIANRLLRLSHHSSGSTGRVRTLVSTICTVGRLALADTALYLNERSKEVVVVCAEPHGACNLVLVCGWVTRRAGMARLMRKESADARNEVTKSLEGIAVGRSYLFPGPERFDQVKASQRRVVGGLAAQRLAPNQTLRISPGLNRICLTKGNTILIRCLA